MGHDRFVLTTDVLARMTARKEGRCENSPGLFLWAKNRPRDHRTNNLVLLDGRSRQHARNQGGTQRIIAPLASSSASVLFPHLPRSHRGFSFWGRSHCVIGSQQICPLLWTQLTCPNRLLETLKYPVEIY